MKILAIFHSKIFCKNQGNFSDKECSQKKFGLVPIITTSLFWWFNVLVRWSKYQINFHRGVLQKLYNFRWLAVSLWEKLDTTAQSVFDRADSWTGKVYHHLAAKRRTYTVKSPIQRSKYRTCLTLLRIASTGNQTPDVLSLSPRPYPLGHMLPRCLERGP